ncbi:MAG: hypothetical protein DI536_07345 [Archangium gephyra]|uniref:Uncharacterized protein n=1 Tax=Archangium gephyra TaxID=48 RepID=A0A2W5TKJ5_9BACT|nr:MAG: hypothetical protein DI536_07345 [Archangium gephyra]
MRRNGETNPVTWIVVLALIGVGFYGFHVGPVYMDNLEVKEAASEAFNVYFNDGEDLARRKLIIRLNEKNFGTHLEVDENGVESWKPGLGIDPERVTFVEGGDGTLRVTVSYDRVVIFSPLKKRKTFHVSAEKVGKRLK